MKRWLKRWLPTPARIEREKSLRRFSAWLNRHPYVWAINRRSVSRGVAAGLLVAFIPLPVQFLLSAIMAYFLRGNVPIAFVSTLFSNPFTLVPITYVIYKVGIKITSNGPIDPPPTNIEFHWANFPLLMQELGHWLGSLGKAYFIGLLVVSICASVIGYVFINILWIISIKWQLRMRRNRQQKAFKK